MNETPNLDKGPGPDHGSGDGQWADHGAAPPPPTNPYAAGSPYASYDQMPWATPPDHPQTATVLILGILSIVLCQVTGPFAWVMGKRALAEIDASGGRIGGRSNVQVGYVCGIVGTVLLGVFAAVFVVYLLIVVVAVSAGA